MSSEIKVSFVKAKDGTAGISIADSTGRVTFTETNPSITLGSNATFPTGHIIQTENASFSTQTSHANDDWGNILSVNITPKYNNSKIMVSFYCTVFAEGSTGNFGYGFRIQRTAPSSAGVLGQTNTIGGAYFYASSGTGAHQIVHNNGGSSIDTPATYSQVTYAMQIEDTHCGTCYSQYGGNTSHLIAQEIKV